MKRGFDEDRLASLATPKSLQPTPKATEAAAKKGAKSGDDKAKELLVAHRQTLETIAKALLEYETLDGAHIREIMNTGSIQNPPVAPRPPNQPPPLKPKADIAAPVTDLPPGLSGAPA